MRPLPFLELVEFLDKLSRVPWGTRFSAQDSFFGGKQPFEHFVGVVKGLERNAPVRVYQHQNHIAGLDVKNIPHFFGHDDLPLGADFHGG